MKLYSNVEIRYNVKTKVYTDGTTNSLVCREAIFKSVFDVPVAEEERFRLKHELAEERSNNILEFLAERGERVSECESATYKEAVNTLYPPHEKVPHDNSNPRNDSVKRAKDNIFDYIMNNEFEYFFTGTINPQEFDSKEPKELFKPVQNWLKNMVKRYSMDYIIIAELHKSGCIHFHGLFKALSSLKLEDSGTKLYRGYKKPVSDCKAIELGLDLSEGRIVYNLKTWRFGWSTCIKLIGKRINIAYYVTKYITKDCKKIFGKFFWHSRSLQKPLLQYDDVDYESVDVIDRNGFKYIFRSGDLNDENRESIVI